jgi:hypothetical protein
MLLWAPLRRGERERRRRQRHPILLSSPLATTNTFAPPWARHSSFAPTCQWCVLVLQKVGLERYRSGMIKAAEEMPGDTSVLWGRGHGTRDDMTGRRKGDADMGARSRAPHARARASATCLWPLLSPSLPPSVPGVDAVNCTGGGTRAKWTANFVHNP